MDYIRLNFKTNTRGTKKNQQGELAIVLEVYKNRKERKRIPTGISIKPKYWDLKHQKIKKTHPNHTELNSQLDYIKSTRECFIDEMNRKHNCFKMSFFEQFDDGSKSRECFISYMETYSKRIKGVDISIKTYTSHKNKINHLKEFRSTIPFESFNIHLIEELNRYFIQECNYKPNTIHNHHKIYKRYVRKAIRDKYIKPEDNPYLEHKSNWKRVKVEYLKPSELNKLEKYTAPNERMQKVKDAFLFSCYTGLAHADYCNISFEDIKQSDNGNYFIQMDRQKTGKKINLPLSKLFPVSGTKSKSEQILIKYIEKYKDIQKSPKTERYFFRMSNQKMNEYLKTIAKKCKIDKSLTTHFGRHTFGTILCNDLNIPITVVKELMSHSNIAQTAKYVITNDNVIDTMLSKANWEEIQAI